MFQVLHIVYAFTIKFPVTFVNYRKKYAFFLTMNECILHLSSLPAMYFILKILKPLVHARKLSRNSFIKKHYSHFTYLTKCTLSCFFLFFTC